MRTYTIINLVGLIASLTGSIVIARYVHQELTVDSHIPDLDRMMVLCNVDEGRYRPTLCANYNHFDKWDDALSDSIIECYTQVQPIEKTTVMNANGIKVFPRTMMADTMFLKMFSYDVVCGNLSMKDVHDVVVCQQFAERTWPGESPIGKKLQFYEDELNVVGVIAEAPAKSNLNFDIIVNTDLRRLSFNGCTFIKIAPGTSWKDFNKRHEPFLEKLITDDNLWHFQLLPLKDVYFSTSFFRHEGSSFFPAGNITNIKMLIGAAMLLLIVGLFNFINIYAIIMTGRRKEFAIKKTFGANTCKIFMQIFTENFILSLISVILSWTCVLFASPLLEKYFNVVQLPSVTFDITITVCTAFLFPLFVSIPMLLYVNRSFGIEQLKQRQGSAINANTKTVALGVQYVVTFILIVVSLFSMCQFRYMLNADMGYRTTDIIKFNMAPQNDSKMEFHSQEEYEAEQASCQKKKEHAKVLMDKIKQSPLFTSCTFVDESEKACLTTSKKVGDYRDIPFCKADSKQEFRNGEYVYLSKEQIDLYGIELLEGRFLNAEEEQSCNYKIIITEHTKKLLGIKDIHKDKIQFERRIWYSCYEDCSGNPPYEIVGVVKNFKTHHLASSDPPKFIIQSDFGQSVQSHFLARIEKGKQKEAIAFLEDLYSKEDNMGTSLKYSRIEDEMEEIYKNDRRTSSIYSAFAILAIIISCLGQFGISLYDIRLRRREIAIRKVNGAKLKDIFLLMSRRYVAILAIAITLAIPLTVLALRSYVEGYANHIGISPFFFIGATFLMLCLILLTIFWQIRKAASENPAEVMKSE